MTPDEKLKEIQKLKRKLRYRLRRTLFFNYPDNNYKQILNMILPLQLDMENTIEYMICEKLKSFFGKRKLSAENDFKFYESFMWNIMEKTSFRSKLYIAREMNLISPTLFSVLKKVSEHRNKFIHSKIPISTPGSFHYISGKQLPTIELLKDFNLASDLIYKEFIRSLPKTKRK